MSLATQSRILAQPYTKVRNPRHFLYIGRIPYARACAKVYIAHALLIGVCSDLLLVRKTCSQDLYTFCLIALHCGRTLLRGIVSNGNSQNSRRRLVTERETKWPLLYTTCSNIIRMRVFRGVKWPTMTLNLVTRRHPTRSKFNHSAYIIMAVAREPGIYR